jgi:hypothetical protein
MTITKCLALVVLFSCVSISNALSIPKMSAVASKRTIFDIPVSNNGARCRVILYKKEIPESEVSITSPATLGGLKSEEYLAVNPQGKMPTMICSETGMNLAESDTISRYLLTKYKDQGPSFQIDNPKSNLMCRIRKFCRAVHLIPSNDAPTSSYIVHTLRRYLLDNNTKLHV